MSNDSGEERTEKATPKRLEEIRKEGSLQKSQDLSAWAGIGAGVALIPFVFGRATTALLDQLSGVADTIADPSPERAQYLLIQALGAPVKILTPLLIAVVVVAIIASAAVGGVRITPARLKPKFKQFNLIKGLKNMFSVQSLWNGAKSLLKTIVIGAVLYTVVQHMMPIILSSGSLAFGQVIESAKYGINRMLWTAVAAGIGLAVIDIYVVMRRNRKKTRMTKKEVRDELKNTEGDPLIKGQRRSRQLAMSHNRMIANVAEADVVVVNPAHVAIALKYTPGAGAPTLIAKGAGFMARRIREKAEESRVPMVADVPLARAIYGACDLGEEIPEVLFTAVAQVLAFVMMLKKRGAATAAVHTMSTPTEVPEDMFDAVGLA